MIFIDGYSIVARASNGWSTIRTSGGDFSLNVGAFGAGTTLSFTVDFVGGTFSVARDGGAPVSVAMTGDWSPKLVSDEVRVGGNNAQYPWYGVITPAEPLP